MPMDMNEFHAAVGRLEAMSKSGASQLHHTASDSDPGTHAGTSTSDYQDEHNDGIDDNGTDYAGVKKALARKVENLRALTKAEVAIVKGLDPRPAILAKIQKGGALTQAESWALKGGAEQIIKGADKPGTAGTPGEADSATTVPDTHGGESEQDEIEPDAKKSFNAAATRQPQLNEGLNMSPLLSQMVTAIGTGLSSVQSGVRQDLIKALTPVVERLGALEAFVSKSFNEQGEFNKSIAPAVVGLVQHVAGGAEVAASQANMPAAAPKSQFRAVPGGAPQGQPQGVQPVQKSFGPGGLDTSGEAMSKSLISSTMSDLVEKGQVNPLDVIKFEMTGEISQPTQQLVMQHAQAGGIR